MWSWDVIQANYTGKQKMETIFCTQHPEIIITVGHNYEFQLNFTCNFSIIHGHHQQICATTNVSRRTLPCKYVFHYSDVIMSAVASQITGVSIVYLTVCSGVDPRNHQSSASLAFVRGIHRWTVNSPHKGPVTRKIFPFDDVIMSFRLWNLMHRTIKCNYMFRSMFHVIQRSGCDVWIINTI